MQHFFPAIIVAGVLAACGAPHVQKPAMPTSITLQANGSAAIGGATLRYDGANDSRCRPGVQCVWAGEVSYKFTLSGVGGNEAFSLTRAKPAHEASTVKGVRISLSTAEDPPLTPASTPARAYPVSVTITRP